MISQLAFNEFWVMVSSSGESESSRQQKFSDGGTHPRVWYEGATLIKDYTRSVPPSQIIAYVPKNSLPSCQWEYERSKSLVRDFCCKYEGYQEICRCSQPLDPTKMRYSSKSGYFKEIIPLALLTAVNAWNFYRQILNLFAIDGASDTPMVVFIDGYNKEIVELASLFQLPVYIHRPQGDVGSFTRLNMHFKFSVFNIFNLHPETKKAIILEDDLLLSPDFLKYFHQTSWLLDADPSIYCINAFSVNSVPAVASDPTKLRRSNAFPQFGWLITKEWAEELIPKWVHENANNTDWDWWLGLTFTKQNRHVIVPEVSRTFHAGSAGAHVTGWEQAFFYDQMIYNQNPDVKIRNIHHLQEEVYDNILEEKIKNSILLKADFNPCDDSVFNHKQNFEQSFRIAVKAEDKVDYDDSPGLYVMALCLHGFPRDSRDTYKGVQEYNVRNNRIYIVGCPASPFCKVWGENITLMDPSDDIIDLAERRDFMWRSANHSGNYLLRQKAFNDEEEFAMTNTRVGKRNFKSYL
ncbi:UNVERIFIED_CONTAM: hypothetical protein RMT77_012526 [Armadillidium vulgare]